MARSPQPPTLLQFFAVSNRLFQPHTAESRNLSDEGVDFLEEYSKKPSPTGTDEERRKQGPDMLSLSRQPNKISTAARLFRREWAPQHQQH